MKTIDRDLDPVIKNAILQAPILLSGVTGVLTPGSKMGVTDTTRLQNPFDGPMLIDEIRFRIDTGNTDEMYAGRMHVKLRLGDLELTHDLVPIALLGRRLNPGGQATVKQFTWRLHHPLWVPAGGYVEPIFFWDNFGFNDQGGVTGVKVTVTYVGRPLRKGTPKPAKYRLPWVASYKTAPKTTTGTASYESTEADLVNPFNVPLTVHRIGGQVQTEGQDANTLDPNIGFAYPILTHVAATMRMVDNLGRIVIRDATPFANVIKPVDDSWTVNAVLPPHGSLRAMIDLDDTSDIVAGNVQIQLAIIGTREI